MDQFRRDTMDRSDAGQRRSVRLYAMGQVFLGALIVALFLVARSVDERNPRVVAAEPATVGTPASPVTSGPASKLSPAVAKVIPQSLPHDEVPTGTATTVTPTPAPHSESDDRAGDVGATPARPQLPDGAQSPNKEQPSDRVPPRPAPRASEAERKRDQQRATAVAEPPRAREQEIPAADVEPALPSGGDDQQAPFATDRGQSPESTDMQQPHHPQEESQLPDNNGSAAFAQDGSSTPEASAKTNVPTEGRFALQLITFNNVSRARSFAREFDIIDDSRYMRVENGNRSWYSVLVGNYATRVEGQAAVDTLPARLRELDPWVRWLPAGARLISVEASSEAASSE